MINKAICWDGELMVKSVDEARRSVIQHVRITHYARKTPVPLVMPPKVRFPIKFGPAKFAFYVSAVFRLVEPL